MFDLGGMVPVMLILAEVELVNFTMVPPSIAVVPIRFTRPLT